MKIKIVPLELSHAAVSWKWRNDPEIWKFTGKKPDKYITREMEEEWMKKVLSRADEKRFAICVGENAEYAGNIFLTHITDKDAQAHLFIGEKNFFSKGVGTYALKFIINYGLKDLKLEEVYGFINQDNSASIKACEKAGFKLAGKAGDQVKVVARSE